MTYTDADLLVDCQWLQAHLDDPGLRIVDCDVPDAYRRAHVPGALTYDVFHYLKDKDDPRFIMSPGQFAAAMATLGISDDTEVVAYDGSGNRYAARLWFCLNYYGHARSRVLNGGWNRWLAEARPVTMAPSKAGQAGIFNPRRQPEIYADAQFVMQALQRPDALVLDVRSEAEWLGIEDRGNKRAGHMPGAVHLEWSEGLTPEQTSWRDAEELRSMFQAAGVTPDKEIVTVCQGGIRAAQAAFTLRLLGYDRVRVYDGSFLDWANREDTPLV